MIVDSHVHLGMAPEASARGSIPTEFTTEELLDNMKLNNIEISIIFGYGRLLDNSYTHNKVIENAILEYPNKFIGFVRVNPWYANSIKEIDYFIKESGFKGIKLHTKMESFSLNDKIVFPIIEKASKFRIPVIIDGDPAIIGDLADQYENVTFIIAHMAGGYYHTAFFVAKKCDNIILETSVNTWTHRILRSAIDLVGPERIIWGSDTPFHTPEVELKKIEMAKITDNEKEFILGKNIKNILNY